MDGSNSQVAALVVAMTTSSSPRLQKRIPDDVFCVGTSPEGASGEASPLVQSNRRPRRSIASRRPGPYPEINKLLLFEAILKPWINYQSQDKSADSKSAVQIERQSAMRRRVYAPCMQTPLSFAPTDVKQQKIVFRNVKLIFLKQ
ncbi:unnamed protein product [Caenorhabditis auriculariae]|uniref:Uncharacterized protein n=1 Tax=Caenorhabditis auriculariae TaxID=2777116 RepID=A0A8S1HCJ0_9PELO|nr:unnamed protein product [Caenorhabditis auriculariae]